MVFVQSCEEFVEQPTTLVAETAFRLIVTLHNLRPLPASFRSFRNPAEAWSNSLRSQRGFVLLGILVEFHLAIFRAEIDCLALVLRSVQRACLINFHVANRIFGHSRSSCKFGWGGLKTRWLDSLRSP